MKLYLLLSYYFRERRHTFALYLFVRALDLIYHHLVFKEVIPKLEYKDLTMFSLTTCLIMYAWHYEPQMLAKSFHKFISARGGIIFLFQIFLTFLQELTIVNWTERVL